MKLLVSHLIFLALTASVQAQSPDEQTTSYGLDVSFPTQRHVSENYPWLPHNTDPKNNPTPSKFKDVPIQPLGDRQWAYLKHLNGCREAYGNSCDSYEYDRMIMNRRQPQSMTNYTKIGFKKIRAPDDVFQLVSDFWKHNHYKGQPEQWPTGNSYLNHWFSPSYQVSVDDRGLRGSGPKLKEKIWSAAAATLEEWTSQELQPCSMYGIRVYGEGAVMLPHVDRLPLVASAMINVAQDVEEDWPFELYDHSGKAHNVTLKPGDMLLFESHSVIHGHPFPLKGSFYAMIFMHFEPTGQPLHHDVSGYHRSRNNDDVDKLYRESVKNKVGGQSAASGGSLPPYIKRESPEEDNWRRLNPTGWKPPAQILPLESHLAAKAGKIEELREELDSENSNEVLTERDEKGWQVLHQGVSSGNKDVVELIVNHGAEINSRTHGGYGESPLRIAEKQLGQGHPVARYLKSLGALSLGPEL